MGLDSDRTLRDGYGLRGEDSAIRDSEMGTGSEGGDSDMGTGSEG